MSRRAKAAVLAATVAGQGGGDKNHSHSSSDDDGVQHFPNWDAIDASHQAVNRGDIPDENVVGHLPSSRGSTNTYRNNMYTD
jgi:hypothetical protein